MRQTNWSRRTKIAVHVNGPLSKKMSAFNKMIRVEVIILTLRRDIQQRSETLQMDMGDT
jgi:hypothetical protein